MKLTVLRYKLMVVSFLIALGLIVNSLTISKYTGHPDRNYFKALSVAILIFAFALHLFRSKTKFNLSLFFELSPLVIVFFSLAISDLFNNGDLATNAVFRALVNTIFLLLLTSLSYSDLRSTLVYTSILYFLIVCFGILEMFLGNSTGEVFPIINIRSIKSLVFEQNVFAIGCFLTTVICLLLNQRRMILLALVVGSVLSFYRTVYPLIAGLYLSKLRRFVFLLGVVIFLYFFLGDLIGEALKLHQLSNLTGRTDLWVAALKLAENKPVFGYGESAIPIYSNLVFNKINPYTTWHNSLIDLLFSAGLCGLVTYVGALVYYLLKIKRSHALYFAFVLAPGISNTFYVGSYNLLGGMSALILVYFLQYRRQR